MSEWLARAKKDLQAAESELRQFQEKLSQHCERAKMNEAREIPAVQLLDPAIPAVRPAKPSLRFNLSIAGAAGLLIGFAIASVVDYSRRSSSAGQRDQ